MNAQALVYWLYNDDCLDPAADGYVGITNNGPIRLRAHRYGRRFPAGFKFAVLFEGARSLCLAEEQRLRPIPGIGWNVASGGNAGRLHLAASCAKISAARRGRKLSDEALQRRKALKPVITDETRAKMRAAAVGRKLSDAAKAKLSAAFKGRPLSAAHRAKMSATAKGRTFSAETRAKMSIAAKARWAQAAMTDQGDLTCR